MIQLDEWKLVREIEKAGKNIYKSWQSSLKYDVDFQVKDVRDFLKDHAKAVKWFSGQTFWAGRRDWLSDRYRRAFFVSFDRIFDNSINDAKIRGNLDELIEQFRIEVSKLKKKSGESYKVRSKDEVALKSALQFVADSLWEYAFNPVRYLKDKIEKHQIHQFFEDVIIPQVGKKLKSMVVRDVAVWYDLRLNEDELIFIFPVDVWVNKLCTLIWPDTRSMNKERLVRYMVDRLKGLRASPTYFNGGLWALGWYGRGAVELLLESKS
jgi:hypothetical protein